MENKRKSFTLIELLIVIAIIAILAAITIPQFAGIINRANDAVVIGALNNIQTQTVAFRLKGKDLSNFCDSPFIAEVESTIQGTGIDATDIICIDSTDFVIMSSALHADNAYWVVDSTGRTGLGASLKGLVGYWRFHEGRGTTARDSSGLNHGTLLPVNSEPTWDFEALRFDGVNDFVQTTYSTGFNGALPHTVIMFVKLDTITPVHGHQEFFNFNVWEIGMWWHGSHGAHINRFRVHQTDGTTGLHSTIALPPHTNWIQLGQVFDGTTIKHIINGEIIAGTVTSFSVTGAHLPKIGRRFPGLIDDVRIYNRALSAAEIKAQFEAGR